MKFLNSILKLMEVLYVLQSSNAFESSIALCLNASLTLSEYR